MTLALVGGDECVVGLPGAGEHAADVGEDVGVLAEETDGFVEPGLAELGDNDGELGEVSGDFIQ